MGKQDGNLPGPAVTGEELPEDEEGLESYREGLEGEKLVEEEPNPNQHGPAIEGGALAGDEALEAWREEYSISPSEYLARYGEDAGGSELAQAALNAEEA